MGRDRPQGIKNAARIIDIDILLCDDLIIETNDLIVPHPRAHLRGFVLMPLADLCPNFCFPIINKTVKELLEKIDKKDIKLFN